MRKTYLLTLFYLITFSSIAQNRFGDGQQRMIAQGNLPPVESEDNIQTRFAKQIWTPGIVTFKSAGQKLEAPMLFDIYSNTFYFLRDNKIMEFAVPVKEVVMKMTIKGDSADVVFRNSYPAIERNTEETFYEVLVDGNFQLLKCRAKTIYLHKDENDKAKEPKNFNKSLLYAYLPDNKIILIKKDSEYLMEQAPQYASAIKNILQTHKIKLRNEESIKELFQHLNSEVK